MEGRGGGRGVCSSPVLECLEQSRLSALSRADHLFGGGYLGRDWTLGYSRFFFFFPLAVRVFQKLSGYVLVATRGCSFKGMTLSPRVRFFHHRSKW